MTDSSREIASLPTWTDVLRYHACQSADRVAYSFLADGCNIQNDITYGKLDRRARAIACELRERGLAGNRALLLYPPGLDFIEAFMGCLYAGVAAIPAYPPQNARAKRGAARLNSILQDAQPGVILTLASLHPSAEALLSTEGRGVACQWVTTDTIPSDFADSWRAPDIGPDTLAFLQYTSGSTTEPKGVMVLHRNLLHNELLIKKAFEHTNDSVVAGWLPLYHDMGLIGNVLQPLYCGSSCFLMPPVAFLQQPLRWLSLISRHRVTTSGGPDFAYDLCVRKISSEQKATLDLSSWKVAFNGAEPIRHENLKRFAEAFAPCGFREESFYPCYGLAEATLIVSGGKRAAAPVSRSFSSDSLEREKKAVALSGHDKSRTLIGCGQALENQTIAIVEPESQTRCPPENVGEIWVAGPSIATGYWQRPTLSHSTFHAVIASENGTQFLRTGDLGFFYDGELFITGRLKDLIIIRGRNHYPQDLEWTAGQAHAAVRFGSGAAFSIERDGEEQLVIVHEIERQFRHSNLDDVVSAIRQSISDEHELNAHFVVLIKPGSIPKTSSGKIQRHLCRLQFDQNKLDVLRADVTETAFKIPPTTELTVKSPLTSPPETRELDLLNYLVQLAARILRADATRLAIKRPLSALGLDSLGAVEFASRIETELGIVITMAELFETANLSSLATSLLPKLEKKRDATHSNPVGTSSNHPTIPGPESRNLPATPAQQSLWLLQNGKQASSLAYNILVEIRLAGRLHFASLQQSLQTILARHDVFRTAYVASEDGLLQRVTPTLELAISEADLSGLTARQRKMETRQLAATVSQCPFNLATELVFRPYLLRLDGEKNLLSIVMHHITCDGWSVQLFLQELADHYRAFSADAVAPQIARPTQYSDFMQEREQTPGDDVERGQLDYWQGKLAGHQAGLTLPTDYPGPSERSFQSALTEFKISGIDHEKLKRFSREQAATPFMVLLTVFKVLLGRCSSQNDLVVGSSVANRAGARAQKIIGPFTNAVALRTDLAGDPTFENLLTRVRQTCLEAYSNQNVCFDKVLAQFQRGADRMAKPLFNVVFLLQSFLTPSWEMNGVAAELEEFDTGMSNFDLALVFYEKNGELIGSLKYSPELFSPETAREIVDSYCSILAQAIQHPLTRLSQFELVRSLPEKTERARLRDQHQTIAVTANFTAELLEAPIAFWMRLLDVPARIAFAGHDQVFQQLLDPQSLLSRNHYGINVLLIRLAEWEKVAASNGHGDQGDNREKSAADLLSALASMAARSPVPHLVCFCPSGSEDSSEGLRLGYQQMENRLASEMEKLPGVHIVTSHEILTYYPVSPVFDATAHQLGRVPFTSPFFLSLGTMIARKFQALRSAPYKVIVTDCDQTLWQGVCAEDGALGVIIDAPRKALQEFLSVRQQAGMLLCLCSKNDEQSVLDVFERRSDMSLSLKQIAARKINWKPKSENIKVLAQELGVSLDSFIFLDDNPLECQEVQSACPTVLTLQLPTDAQRIPDFLRNLWALDTLKNTGEDQQRTRLYQQHALREQFRQENLTLDDFLSGLQLECDIHEMRSDELSRVAQLTLRTNQFNTTGIRYSEAELSYACHHDAVRCFVVNVRDRFGDYGLVGAMLTKPHSGKLSVSVLLLSCRALGRRIENRMVSYLGATAAELGLEQVEIPFIVTEKNRPAYDFLEEVASRFRVSSKSSFTYSLPVEAAIAAKQATSQTKPESPAGNSESWKTPLPTQRFEIKRARSDLMGWIASTLCTVPDIEGAMRKETQSGSVTASPRVTPSTPTEKILLEIWQNILHLEVISADDNFFHLGGHSLAATILIARIRKVFHVEMPLDFIFEKPTIGQLAVAIEDELIGRSDEAEMAAAAEELNGMSEEQITALLAKEEELLRAGGGLK